MPRRLSDRIAVAAAWLTGLVLIGVVGVAGGLARPTTACSNVRPRLRLLQPGARVARHGRGRRRLRAPHRNADRDRPRHRRRAAARPGDGAVPRRVPPPLWLARLADTAIDLIFGVPSIVFALFGLAIFQNGFFIVPLGRGRDVRQGDGRLVPVRLADDEPDRAAADRARRRKSSIAGVSSDAARGGLLARQGPAGHHPPGGPAGGTARRRDRAPSSASGRIAGDTAIVWLLLGGSVLAPPDQGWWQPDQWAGHAARRRLHTDDLHLLRVPGRRGQRRDSSRTAAAFVLMVLMVDRSTSSVSRFARRQAWKTR